MTIYKSKLHLTTTDNLGSSMADNQH